MLLGLLGADRQVGDQHLGAAAPKHLGDVDRRGEATRRRPCGSTCRARRGSGRARRLRPSAGTSEKRIVLLLDAKTAFERSRPTLAASTSKAATNSVSPTW